MAYGVAPKMPAPLTELHKYEAGPTPGAQKYLGVPTHLPEHSIIVRGVMRTYLQIFRSRTPQLVEKFVKNSVFDPWQGLANHS